MSEIMVCRTFTGQGIAHALHDQLLAGRKESRATLTVKPDNKAAYRADEKWGWRKATPTSARLARLPAVRRADAVLAGQSLINGLQGLTGMLRTASPGHGILYLVSALLDFASERYEASAARVCPGASVFLRVAGRSAASMR